MNPESPSHPTIHVWLIEDNEIYRRGLARAIDAANDLSCDCDFDCAEDAFTELDNGNEHRPDVMLLDVGLPGMDGLTAISRLRELCPSSRIVILTVFNDSDKIFKAVCSGANGYLLKTASTEEVVTAVRQASEGGAPMGAQVAARVLSLFAEVAGANRSQSDDYGLSPRETEVLSHMAEGLVTKEIAAVLGISNHTVTNQIRSIYAKLHVNTNTGAVAKAIREGLV